MINSLHQILAYHTIQLISQLPPVSVDHARMPSNAPMGLSSRGESIEAARHAQ